MIFLFGMLIGMLALGGIVWAISVAFDDPDELNDNLSVKSDPNFYRYDPL